MKIKCVSNTNEFLIQKNANINHLENYEDNIIIGKEYIIYAISYYENHFNYLMYDNSLKPNWYFSELFDEIDNQISSTWFCKIFNQKKMLKAIWGYKELVNIENHYDDLLEREQVALDIFYKRKKEMDVEFLIVSIKEKADILDKDWLMCPFCNESWKSTSKFGMIECRKCKKIMHNPRYIN